MDAFDLDAKVTTPATGVSSNAPVSITSILTRVVCPKTPACSKSTCKCTTIGICTSSCRR
ncbi:FDLD family class I lanthipeptide [Amycolatopsis sp. NPDC004079]|uniref:FDLD family class I lanthipeptide n=1 Tax=Amycolatopsis sp. NPDC004079 TaxID=3154549 RepID=UPI0033AE6500